MCHKCIREPLKDADLHTYCRVCERVGIRCYDEQRMGKTDALVGVK